MTRSDYPTRTATALGVLLIVFVTAVAPAAATVQTAGPAQAELSIQQPHYVGAPVESTTKNDSVVYTAHGGVLELYPENFDPDNVVSYGVKQSGAALTFDDATGEFQLDVREGGAGTYRVTFTVAREVNNSTTRQQYTALIQVEQTNYAHVEESRYDQLRDDAENYSAVVSAFAGVGPDSMPVAEKIESAIEAWQFINNPLRLLSGDFTAAATILLLTNGGRILLGLLLLLPLVAVSGAVIAYRRLRRETPDYEDIETEKMQLLAEQRKNLLVETTPHDLPVGERTAQRLDDIAGENLWQILQNVLHVVGDAGIKLVHLRAMLNDGWAIKVARDGNDITDATLVEPGTAVSATDDEAVIDRNERGALTEELAAAVDWAAIDWQVLDSDTDPDAVDVDPVITPLLDDWNVAIPEDFDDRRAFADALFEVFRFVDAHEYTDEHGEINEEQSLLNIFGLLTTVTAERYDVPQVRRFRDTFGWLANSLTTNQHVHSAAQEDGLGDLDIDFDSNAD